MALKITKTNLARINIALATLLLASGYGITTAAPALADPSAATQQFFGFSSGGGGSGSALPESCSIKKIQAQNQVLLDQISQLESQAATKQKALNDQISELPPGSDTDHVKENAIKQQETDLIQQTEQQVNAIKAKQEELRKATQGPSDECKSDLVGQTVADVQRTVAAINGGQISATMAKITKVQTEIENLVPSLGKAGVNNTDIATVKKDLDTVRAATATLNGFFGAMSSKGSAFISSAQANPVGTYDQLQSGGGPLSGISGGASAAADNLVSSFTSLVNLFDKLTGAQEGQ